MLSIGLSNRRFRAKRGNSKEGLVSGCDAANLLLEISAGAMSGCGFSLSRPREGRQLPSERTANGGIILIFGGIVLFLWQMFFMMRKFIFLLAALFGLASAVMGRVPVRSANYDLASRFSAKRVDRMVFSTRVRPHWFKGSNKFWYEWRTSEGVNFYVVDPERGTKEAVFDMERLAMELTEIVRDPFDRQHIPFRDLKLADDRCFSFSIESSAIDRKDSTGKKRAVFYFEYELKSKKLKQTEERMVRYPSWANVSPDGRWGVYAKNSNLYKMDSTSLRKAARDERDSTIVEHRLTDDGVRQYGYGFDNYSGDKITDTTKRHFVQDLVWSPDSKHFAVFKWDMRKIQDFWVINSLSAPRPTLETYKYQMPGERGPKGFLYVFDMTDGSRKFIKTEAFKDQDMNFEEAIPVAEDAYNEFSSTKWLGDSNGFYMYRLSRDLKRLDVCHVDISADSTKTVISERSNTYIEKRRLYPIKGGKELIHWSERNGWANLYLYSADGRLIRNLTEGAFHVEDILGVNEKEGYVLFSACGFDKNENPYQMHTFRVSFAGEGLRQLDMRDMDVLSKPSFDGRFFVANYSRADYKPATALYNAKGKKLMDLEEADFSRLFEAGYKFPERFKVKAADGITDLYGLMYKPFDFDSTKSYPVCDYVYPGPQVEAVNISWSKGFTRTDRLAQLGFIVVTVGNRGGHPNRSKWYHNYGYGNLRDYGLEDQKYALQQLGERHHFMDMSRVGIHGHSGGGFMSTAAILTYPDFFKVAVSCAGNHDNSIYNRWWSEQHHGILEKISAGDTTFVYKINTNQELAKNLKGHLMLCTGDMDNNVNPANTIRVEDALIRANKRFDLLVLPGQRHGFGDMNEYFFWRMADYYSLWLMGDYKKRSTDIVEMNND